MSMIQVEHLTFSYPGSYDNVFQDATFRLDTDWKLGLIGRNGRGKTTLLLLLRGEFEFEGKITSSVAFDYFPYPISDPERHTCEILDEICPMAEEWERMRELSCLGVDTDVLWREFHTLSNGEQTKVLLAALFLKPEHFLLIDEPTNHLDTEGRRLVASYLKKKTGFILVSHDRVFLDECIDRVMSINRRNIEVQAGNFTSWQENFERQEEFERARDEKLKKDIGKLQDAARRTADWSDRCEASKKGAGDRGFVGAQAARMMKRSKGARERREKAVEERSALLRNVEVADELALSPLTHHAKTLVRLDDVAVCYDSRTVCAGVKLTIYPGDRVALEGRNGCGKSSLLKLVLGEEIPHTGLVSVAPGLVISYVSQGTAHLTGNLSELARERKIEESLLKAILRKMGFERVQFEKDMADFSGGQKKKVLLAASLCQRAHLYIWDEPLNFIDVHSRIQIENLIRTFQPTMLFVEHDRAFQRSVATNIISF